MVGGLLRYHSDDEEEEEEKGSGKVGNPTDISKCGRCVTIRPT